MKDQIEEFRAYRAKMNERILAADNKVIKRIYNIDTNTYMEGALSSKVKEMLGLATSMVLRCDDCIKYHLEKCYEQGVTTPELFEVFAVADVVGGTTVIPHALFFVFDLRAGLSLQQLPIFDSSSQMRDNGSSFSMRTES